MDRVRFEYKRSLSTKDQQSRVRMGHRRTQSYTTPETIEKTQNNQNDLRKTFHNRSSANIANKREYFAAPAYNEASLLERKESMRQSIRLNKSATAEEIVQYVEEFLLTYHNCSQFLMFFFKTFFLIHFYIVLIIKRLHQMKRLWLRALEKLVLYSLAKRIPFFPSKLNHSG